MEATDPRAWIGRTVGGRYPIVAPLGRGGAGQVFLARQQPLGREVAVKLLRPELLGSSRDEYQARFLREAALAGRIAHPNVVTVHDYGVEDDGTSYVVMELLHGDLLADLVQGGLALEPHRAARIVRDIAKGLRAAHDLGLVHRDVKPHNVVVVEEDGGERPVLIDFGLVKVHDGEDHDSAYETRKGTYMGTPAYMAPEQARGDGVDPRADLYALGVMLYRLLTGAVPFWADNPLGLAVQHLTEPVPPMEVRAPGCNVPPGLEAIARRLLEKDPARRYADATEVVVALDAWLAGPLPLPEPRGSGTPLAALGAGIGA
ncbi:MAG: serine/threonine protein kinase, partial [Myxococcales bacterium]|nr:serine/threonine protein kinase [Myxococcales bacterium]